MTATFKVFGVVLTGDEQRELATALGVSTERLRTMFARRKPVRRTLTDSQSVIDAWTAADGPMFDDLREVPWVDVRTAITVYRRHDPETHLWGEDVSPPSAAWVERGTSNIFGWDRSWAGAAS